MSAATAFQWVFNNAETLNWNTKSVAAQTIARDNSVRSVSRGGNVWRFEVKMPDGIAWTDARPYIAELDYAGLYTTANVNLNNSNYYTWMVSYKGNITGSTPTGSWTQGASSFTLTSTPAASGYNFRAGDIIQLGSGKVYTAVSDVPYTSTTVPLNRPVIDSTGSGTLNVGRYATFSVVCVQMPQWTIFSRNQVSWSGPFVFYESTT